jgi:hypothetical protein
MVRRSSRFAAGAVLGLSLLLATPAWAAFINVVETGETTDILLTTDGVDIDATTLVITPESVSFQGILHIAFGAGVLFDPLYNFVLTEPGSALLVSDVATITPLGFGGPGAVDWEQPFIYSFLSADTSLFPSPINCQVEETGALQTCGLFSQTGDNILNLGILSDAEEVPEPVSLTLLGVGLVGYGLRRRRLAQN